MMRSALMLPQRVLSKSASASASSLSHPRLQLQMSLSLLSCCNSSLGCRRSSNNCKGRNSGLQLPLPSIPMRVSRQVMLRRGRHFSIQVEDRKGQQHHHRRHVHQPLFPQEQQQPTRRRRRRRIQRELSATTPPSAPTNTTPHLARLCESQQEQQHQQQPLQEYDTTHTTTSRQRQEQGRDDAAGASGAAIAEAFCTMLPQWLTHDPLWLDRTLQELNEVGGVPPIISAPSSSSSMMMMQQQDYRRLYFDSMESFQQRLRSLLLPSLLSQDAQYDDDDTDDTDDGRDLALLTAAARAVLDHVVPFVLALEDDKEEAAEEEANRSSLSLLLLSTKTYWQMKAHQTRTIKMSSDLLLKRQELAHRQERYDEMARELERLLLRHQQQQHTRSANSSSSANTSDDDANPTTATTTHLIGMSSSLEEGKDEDLTTTSFWKNIKEHLKAKFATAAPVQSTRQNNHRNTTPTIAGSLVRKIDKLSRTLRGHPRSLVAMTKQIAKLEQQQQQQQSSQKLPLNPDEFDRFHQMLYTNILPILCRAFAAYIQHRHQQIMLHDRFRTLHSTTDLTDPTSWYPRARLDRRRIIFHGGPTNSGKTYEALDRLKQAKRGMYLGPLRLLAVEVYEKLTADGVYCNLFTGQESREIPFATHAAATMEMASLVDDFDILVIDEIQMLSHHERGYSWTRALIGSRCKEIHVCGGLEAVDTVKRIADSCGDDFELRTYDRFTELCVSPKSLAKRSDEIGSYARNVREGDCIVAFSRNDIFAIKREIEEKSQHKCCVIYGSLPPQTRSQQARRFNDPDSGFDVLVASDAIGMGLNLNIRRIVFNSMYKHDSSGIVRLDHSAVKQISGRAGRRNSPFPIGEVTCRDPRDMPHLVRCMSTDIDMIQCAGLLPTASHIDAFYTALVEHGFLGPSQDLHKTLLQFNEVAKLRGDFFLCRQTDMVAIARELAKLNLSIREKYTLCMCPVPSKRRQAMDVLLRFATKLAAGEVAGVTRSMRPRRAKNFDDLSHLCGIYNDLEQFLWLQHKFPPGNVMEQQAALACRAQTVAFIEEGIANSDKLQLSHCYVAHDKRLRSIWRQAGEERAKAAAEYADEGESSSDEEDEDWNKGTPDI